MLTFDVCVRSDLAWKAAFIAAGLTLVCERVQKGLPAGLYTVKMSTIPTGLHVTLYSYPTGTLYDEEKT